MHALDTWKMSFHSCYGKKKTAERWVATYDKMSNTAPSNVNVTFLLRRQEIFFAFLWTSGFMQGLYLILHIFPPHHHWRLSYKVMVKWSLRKKIIWIWWLSRQRHSLCSSRKVQMTRWLIDSQKINLWLFRKSIHCKIVSKMWIFTVFLMKSYDNPVNISVVWKNMTFEDITIDTGDLWSIVIKKITYH